MSMTLLEKIEQRIERVTESGCWIWMGRTRKGYGVTCVRYLNKQVHRVMYELLINAIPEGLVLDHLCRVRCCVNPHHLEVVTHRTNILRGVGFAAKNARATHCSAGHPFNSENTYLNVKRNARQCRVCVRLAMRDIRKKRSNIFLGEKKKVIE